MRMICIITPAPDNANRKHFHKRRENANQSHHLGLQSKSNLNLRLAIAILRSNRHLLSCRLLDNPAMRKANPACRCHDRAASGWRQGWHFANRVAESCLAKGYALQRIGQPHCQPLR